MTQIKSKGLILQGAPDLVVEVLSPSTAKNDRGHKKDIHEQCGVREYWIVSPKEKTVEVYLLQNSRYVLDGHYTRYSEEELEEMSEEDRAAVITHFQCSLYDDLELSLDDIFYRTF